MDRPTSDRRRPASGGAGRSASPADRTRGRRRRDLQQRRCPAWPARVPSGGPRRDQTGASSSSTTGPLTRPCAWLRTWSPTSTVVQMGRNAGYAAGVNAGVAEASGSHRGDGAQRRRPPRPGLRRGAAARAARAWHRHRGTRLTDGNGDLVLSMRREPKVWLARCWRPSSAARQLGRFWDVGVMVVDHRRYAAETTTDWAEGSTQLISRECLDACGEWDESFFLFSEETEFGLRAKDRAMRPATCPQPARPTWKVARPHDPAKWALLCRNKVGSSAGATAGCAPSRSTLRGAAGGHSGGHGSGDQPGGSEGPGPPATAAEAGRSGVARDASGRPASADPLHSALRWLTALHERGPAGRGHRLANRLRGVGRRAR